MPAPEAIAMIAIAVMEIAPVFGGTEGVGAGVGGVTSGASVLKTMKISRSSVMSLIVITLPGRTATISPLIVTYHT